MRFGILFLLLVLYSCNGEKMNTKRALMPDYNWENLLDDNLSDWDRYLSFEHKIGYDGSPPKNDDGSLQKPVGLNPDGYNIFEVIKEKGESVIRVGGTYYGCLATKKEYANYHFQIKYKWGDKKWTPRKEKLKDSGVLYHSIGPMGAEHWRSWMLSQEFQIMEGHTGDYWSQATSAIDIRAYKPESLLNPLAHASQDFMPIGVKKYPDNYCLRSNNYEKESDDWNTLDLICFEDKSLHIVNGEVVMILQNSRYVNDAGKMEPLTKGKIQLQSEAAELFFKDIKIRNLDSLSTAYQALF